MATFEANLSSLMVFLIEPSTTQANIIRSRLKEVGVQFVQVYPNGAAALAAMREHPPEIAISAMHLDDMTGADLAVAIRTDATLQAVAFILVTSIEDPKQLDLVRQAGACAILPKPFGATELRFALGNALDYLNLGKLEIAGETEHIRVLIVDDSRSARIFLRHALEAMGIRHITEAENGRRAIDAISDQQLDLVFSDFNMPEMDGLQLLQHIRTQSWQASVPVIMVSSENKPEHLAAVRAAGISGFCDKPFEPSALKALVENVLNEAPA